ARTQFRQLGLRCSTREARSNVNNFTGPGPVEISVALFVGAMEGGNEISGKWHIQFVRLSGIAHVKRTVNLNGAVGESLCTHLLAAFSFQHGKRSLKLRICFSGGSGFEPHRA